MKSLTIAHLKTTKQQAKKISMVACYDYWSACIVNQSNIDAILVGDSASMVMHGDTTTIGATVELIALHTKAVSKGAPDKIIISDMPFLSYRKSLSQTMSNIDILMKNGCHGIKLEGVSGNEKTIEYIVKSGVPVIGHIGLTPQFTHTLGGHKIQGTNSQSASNIISEALQLEAAGCSAIVLECIPEALATEITSKTNIPTIGIGAGINVDGQVLVFHDLLGLTPNFNPRFLKKYLNGHDLVLDALNQFEREVSLKHYPTHEHSY